MSDDQNNNHNSGGGNSSSKPGQSQGGSRNRRPRGRGRKPGPGPGAAPKENPGGAREPRDDRQNPRGTGRGTSSRRRRSGPSTEPEKNRAGGRSQEPHAEGESRSPSRRRYGPSRKKSSPQSGDDSAKAEGRSERGGSQGRNKGSRRDGGSGQRPDRGSRQKSQQAGGRGPGPGPGRDAGRPRGPNGAGLDKTPQPQEDLAFFEVPKHPDPSVNPERPSVPPGPGYEEMADEQLKYLRSAAVDAVDNESLLDDISEYDFPEGMDIKDIVGVKLQSSGPVILFDCQNMYLDAGDKVIVETGRGLVLGQVVVPAKRQMLGRGTLQRVIRKASANDLRQREKNKDKEDAAFRLCKDRIERLRLPMKLIKVEYLHGGNKAVFYFSSEGRVDFRELVRDLAKRLHTRIEMRQVGVRDESRMLGGIGVCGLRLCCNTFLRDFQPVSIRMAKDQNLVLNPQKVSGVCGRLLCCLVYEDEAYRSASRGMPRVGRRVLTPEGEGRVRDRDVLKRVLRVQLQDETNLREYRVDDIRPASSQNQQNADQTTDEDKPDTALAEILEDDTESFSTP